MYFQWLKKVVAVAAVMLAANAQAGLITDVEAVNKTLDFGSSKSWTHNILDHGFELGSALSATLTIEFRDDAKDPWYSPFELAVVQIGRFDFTDGGIVNPVANWTGNLGISSLIKLNTDGTLFVKVTSTLGDFVIGNSILNVVTKDVAIPVEVPEPGTLLLLSLGLLGLAVARRKAAV